MGNNNYNEDLPVGGEVSSDSIRTLCEEAGERDPAEGTEGGAEDDLLFFHSSLWTLNSLKYFSKYPLSLNVSSSLSDMNCKKEKNRISW